MCIRDRFTAAGCRGAGSVGVSQALERGINLEHRERRGLRPVSYTHLRAHETVLDLVCRLLLDKKKHFHLTFLYQDL